MTTKIHLATDGQGRPLRVILTPGQAGDAPQAPALMQGFTAQHVLADAAYDSTHKRPIPHDKTIYKARNRIERCFNKLKHFRRIATRYDRRAAYFLAFIFIACAMLWMR